MFSLFLCKAPQCKIHPKVHVHVHVHAYVYTHIYVALPKKDSTKVGLSQVIEAVEDPVKT